MNWQLTLKLAINILWNFVAERECSFEFFNHPHLAT
jgi:hypothetical protein